MIPSINTQVYIEGGGIYFGENKRLYVNRPYRTMAKLDNSSENLQLAESRIRDEDMALAMVNLLNTISYYSPLNWQLISLID